MRLLFVVYDREKYTAGPIINVLRLLPELVRRGHRVMAIVAYRGAVPSNEQTLKDAGVTCISFPFPRFTEDFIYEILKIVRQTEPDVFIPNISFQGAYAGRWIKASGIPVIVSHRSDDDRNWSLADTFILGEAKWRASGLVSVSQYLENEVKKRLMYELPMRIISSGVPLSKYIARHAEGTLKVVYAGRIERRQKRVPELVESFIDILKQGYDFELTLIGEGNEKDALIRKVADSGLSEKIRFKDMATGEVYHQQLSTHHVILLLSDYEGMPGSVIDGMMCGLVPVCLTIHGITDLVMHERTGLLVNNRTSDLLQAMARLQTDVNLRQKLSGEAARHVRENYTTSGMVDKWESLLQEVVEKNTMPRSEISFPEKLDLPTSTILFEGGERKYLPLSYIAEHKIKRIGRWIRGYASKVVRKVNFHKI